jgi:uridine kinase
MQLQPDNRFLFLYGALAQALILPLGPGGDRHYRTQTFDYRSDCPIDVSPQLAPPVDCDCGWRVFVAPRLQPHWDVSLVLDIPVEMALERDLKRDLGLFGTEEVIRQRYTQRYIPAQHLYHQQCHPHAQADIVINNSDPAFGA